MLANLEQHPGPISDTALAKSSYVLFLLPKVASLREVTYVDAASLYRT